MCVFNVSLEMLMPKYAYSTIEVEEGATLGPGQLSIVSMVISKADCFVPQTLRMRIKCLCHLITDIRST